MKTDLTLKLEREIWLTTVKQGVFGCYEVTIGQYGRERVDFMTMDTKGIFRDRHFLITERQRHFLAHSCAFQCWPGATHPAVSLPS